MLLHSNTPPIPLLWTQHLPIKQLLLLPHLPRNLSCAHLYPFSLGAAEKEPLVTSDILIFNYSFTPLSSPLFPFYRHSVSSASKSACSWKGARPQTTKPSPAHIAGNTEGETLPNAQNCSDENKLAAQSRTQIPSSPTCGFKTDRRMPGRRLWAQRIFLLSVFNIEKERAE